MSIKEFSNSFSLTDEIADIVRERILKGEYEIGEKSKKTKSRRNFVSAARRSERLLSSWKTRD